nr:immunoglobulin light chain junction region [Macaca mulatta]
DYYCLIWYNKAVFF